MRNVLTPRLCLAILLLLINACSITPPQNKENICALFSEQGDWYDAALATQQRWGVPVHVQMAIMFQESSFIADARPPFNPAREIQSSAFGYAQAKDETWEHFLHHSHRASADRDNFADASDFIGWYCNLSYQKLNVSKWDASNLYLAYHEGHGGYARQTFLKKDWLMRTAKKVAWRANNYRDQLSRCE
ncbi:MAG: hypothetical protein HOP02_08325 [Methylococcaceae bacterium]|nr:hypothetical protein [Methylococcaceae bacterium]